MVRILSLVCLLICSVGYAAESAFEGARLQKAEFLNTLTTPLTFDVLSTFVHTKTKGDNVCEASEGYTFGDI